MPTSLSGFGEFYVFVLAAFLGYQLITHVPPLLHTPLMAATNAIDAITVVGAIAAAGSGHGLLASVLGCAAVASAMSNVVGGFLITDRMLSMFRRGKAASSNGKQERSK